MQNLLKKDLSPNPISPLGDSKYLIGRECSRENEKTIFGKESREILSLLHHLRKFCEIDRKKKNTDFK